MSLMSLSQLYYIQLRDLIKTGTGGINFVGKNTQGLVCLTKRYTMFRGILNKTVIGTRKCQIKELINDILKFLKAQNDEEYDFYAPKIKKQKEVYNAKNYEFKKAEREVKIESSRLRRNIADR